MAEDLKRALAQAAEKLAKKDLDGALEALRPLLAGALEPATRVEALRIVSLAKLLKGDAPGALAALDEAVDLGDAVGPLGLGRALERRALIHQAHGELAKARADLGRAARAFESAGEVATRALVEDKRGAFAASVGELDRAVALHGIAAALRRGEKPASIADGDRPPPLLAILEGMPAPSAASADPAGEAQCLVHAAAPAHLSGARPMARAALERAVGLLEKGPESPERKALRAEALHNLGVVLSDLGEHALALGRLEGALEIDLARGVAREIGATRLRIALVARRSGDAARARTEAEEARRLGEAAKEPALLLEALLEASLGALAAGDAVAALASAKDAIDRSAEAPGTHARATLQAASCAKALGKKQAAREGFVRARELALSCGDRVLAATAEKEIAGLP